MMLVISGILVASQNISKWRFTWFAPTSGILYMNIENIFSNFHMTFKKRGKLKEYFAD